MTSDSSNIPATTNTLWNDMESRLYWYKNYTVGLSYDPSGIKNVYSLIKEADDLMYQMKSISSKDYQRKLIDFVKKQDKYIR